METSPPPTIVLLRHGRTAWNREEILIGQKDIPLDIGGRQEVESAVEALAGVDAIYSSPLTRSRETAEIIGGRLGLQVELLHGLSERHWGVFEGRPKLERDQSREPEGGETTVEFRERVLKTLQFIEGERPLVVTHSGVIRLLSSQPTSQIPHAEPIELSSERVMSLRTQLIKEGNSRTT